MKKYLILIAFVVLLTPLVLYLLQKREASITSIITQTDTITIYKDKLDVTHANIQCQPELKKEMKEAISKEFYSYTVDTLAPALQIAKDEISRLIRINAKLKGEAKRVVDTFFKKHAIYENKYMRLKINDSLAQYEYDAKLHFVDYHKKKWLFGRDKYYTDISSPDTSFKIHGVQQFRRTFNPEKDKLKISILSNVSISRRTAFSAGIQARFNPDGIFTPSLGIGRTFYFNNSYPYVIGGLEINIYRK